tara:strand:- start:723 stop:1433 length:711 start_codon:yes stop_codon:yes gene_type:complete
MLRLLLAVTVVIALIYLWFWLRKTPTNQKGKAIKLILLYGFASMVLIMVISGRVHWLFALPGLALPWIQRALLARQAWRMFRSSQPAKSGNKSKVETNYFIMILDHDSGDLSGEVLQGKYAGKQMIDLSMENLLELLVECKANDDQSAALLEAYLNRNYGDEWRSDDAHENETDNLNAKPMDRREAAEILGIEEHSSKKIIKDAHRKLIQKLHSDRGGTDYLASLINQARDTLLDE